MIDVLMEVLFPFPSSTLRSIVQFVRASWFVIVGGWIILLYRGLLDLDLRLAVLSAIVFVFFNWTSKLNGVALGILDFRKAEEQRRRRVGIHAGTVSDD